MLVTLNVSVVLLRTVLFFGLSQYLLPVRLRVRCSTRVVMCFPGLLLFRRDTYHVCAGIDANRIIVWLVDGRGGRKDGGEVRSLTIEYQYEGKLTRR